MPLKLVEFREQFMAGAFLIKLTEFEKTGSIDKIFISLGNLIIKFRFQNKNLIIFIVTFTFLLFVKGVSLPFNEGNELNLKRNQKSNRNKSRLKQN